MTGFTIVEIAIVIGLFSLLIGIVAPIGVDSYLDYLLISEVRNFVSLIRRAEILSLANDYGSSHGISAQSDRYVIFQGSSYASRNQSFDEVYLRSGGINIASTTEIIFASISGLPNVSSTIVLNNSVRSETIIVNNQGAINW